MARNAPPATRSRYVRLSAETRRLDLIEAALSCIADDGIRAFTVDRIAQKSGVSRGLVTHHFGSMDALLAALYDQIYGSFLPPPAEAGLLPLLDHLFSDALFNRRNLNIWLTLWSEISNTPALREVHRARYRDYHALVADALSRASSRSFDAAALATDLICLVDGLGLQHCIDPETMPPARARAACLALITSQTGPLE